MKKSTKILTITTIICVWAVIAFAGYREESQNFQDYTEEIAMQKEQLQTLSSRITELNTEIEDLDQELTDKRSELSTVTKQLAQEGSSSNSNTSSGNYDVSTAWIALRNYGKKQFPHGFTLHYILGVIQEDRVDATTYALAATCTVSTSFDSASQKYICSAYVVGSGTDPQNYQVYDFGVYE